MGWIFIGQWENGFNVTKKTLLRREKEVCRPCTPPPLVVFEVPEEIVLLFREVLCNMQIVLLCIFSYFPFLLVYFDVFWDRPRMRVTDSVVAIALFLYLASNHKVSIKPSLCFVFRTSQIFARHHLMICNVSSMYHLIICNVSYLILRYPEDPSSVLW